MNKLLATSGPLSALALGFIGVLGWVYHVGVLCVRRFHTGAPVPMSEGEVLGLVISMTLLFLIPLTLIYGLGEMPRDAK